MCPLCRKMVGFQAIAHCTACNELVTTLGREHQLRGRTTDLHPACLGILCRERLLLGKDDGLRKQPGSNRHVTL